MASTDAPAWIDAYWKEKRRHLDGRRDRTRQVETELNGASRSDLVFGALKNEPNRFRLARTTMRAARAFHVQSERMQTTISDSLRRIGSAKPGRENAFSGACQALRMSATGSQQSCATGEQGSASNDFRAAS